MKRFVRILLLIIGSLAILIALLLLVVFPILTRTGTELSALAAEWQDEGSYITWTSTLPENAQFGELDIFTIQRGDPANPAILFIHGYPTSSFDFYELFDLLSDNYYVVAIDTPGYGLSDKPREGYLYSIADDAHLVQHYIVNVLGLESLAVYTHDKGDSVGLALLGLYEQQEEPRDYTLTHHFITNGNVYLPLAQLTRLQRVLLNKRLGPVVTRYINGSLFANGMRRVAYSMPQADAIIEGVASNIDYQDGGEVQHATIQYLAQRAQFEETWLENLRRSSVPATLIWGVEDPIAPTAVADHVWETALSDRTAPASYWRLPQANHYLQNDQPGVINLLIRQALGEEIGFSVLPEDVWPQHVRP